LLNIRHASILTFTAMTLRLLLLYVVSVVALMAAAPPNDHFGKATRVTAVTGWLQSSNTAATVEPGEPRHLGNGGPYGQSLWWELAAPFHGKLQLNLGLLPPETAVAIYTGHAVNALSLQASNAAVFGTNLQMRVLAGMRYFVAVDNTNNVFINIPFTFVPGPANDYFTNRIVLNGATGFVAASTVDATIEAGESVPGFAPNTLWWEWTPTVLSPVLFERITNSHALDIYTNRNGTLQLLGYPDAQVMSGGMRWLIEAPRPGTAYYLRARPLSSPGPFSFVWFQQFTQIPPNDNYASRTHLTGTNLTLVVPVQNATLEPGEPVFFNLPGSVGSVWLGWQATSDGIIDVSFVSLSGMSALVVYRGTSLQSLVKMGFTMENPWNRNQRLPVRAGNHYNFGIYTSDVGFPPPTAEFSLAFHPSPTNDHFLNALPITEAGAVVATTFGAGFEPAETLHAGDSDPSASIWWKWQTATSGPVTITASAGTSDPVLAVYTGSAVDAVTGVASNKNYLPLSLDSRVTFNAIAGVEYQIAVATTLERSGPVTLSVERVLPPWISWLQPTTNVVAALGDVTTLEAEAASEDSAITEVRFQNGSNVLATVAAPPYQWNLTNNTPGVFQLAAYATDARGVVTATTQLQVRVVPPNDWFTNRFVIPQGTLSTTGTTAGASRDSNEPRQWSTASRVAWWTWTSPSNGTVYLANTMSNAVVFSTYTNASLNTLGLVATSSGRPRATFNAVAGVEYQIAAESEADRQFVLSFVSPPFAANDHFTNALVLVGTNIVTEAINTEASAEPPSEPNHGGSQAGRSLWWTWVAPSTGVAVIRTEGSSFNTTLGVYTGNALNALTLVRSNRNPAVWGNSAVTFQTVAGTTYRIAVDGYQGGSGNIVLSLHFHSPPSNDLFANRIALTGRTNITSAVNIAATNQTSEPKPSIFGANKTVWWSWTAPASGRVVVSTDGSTDRNTVGVYTGTAVNALVQRAAGENILGSNTVVFFDATAGTEYHIQLDSRTTAGGELVLSVLQPDSAANNHFAQATALSGFVTNVSGNNFNATAEAGEPLHEAGATRTVWFRWTPTEPGSVSIVPSNSNLGIAVYTGGAVNALTLVASNASSGSLLGSPTFQATPGAAEYWIAMWLRSAAMNEFAFSIVPNSAPTVQLLTPAPNAVYYPGQDVVLNASAGDPDGAIASVDLWAGPLPRTDVSAPYSFVASNLPLGDYVATARSFDGVRAFSPLASAFFRVAPPNDNRANAEPIMGDYAVVTAQTIGAGKEPGEPAHANNGGGRSIWYAWTATSDGAFAVSTEGSSFDTLLAVYTNGPAADLVLVAENDNRSAFDLWSEVSFPVVAGVTYLIAVDGTKGASGDAQVWFRRVQSNDAFGSAASLVGAAIAHANNFGAGSEPGEPALGAQTSGTLWWNWTAPHTGRYLATTAGSGIDALLAVYSGTALTNLTLLSADDDSAGERQALVRFDAEAGATYRIAVAGYGTAQGDVQLTLATNGVPTLFGPNTLSTTSVVFHALTEPGTTNLIQRSSTLTNWMTFDTRVASGWWTEIRDASAPTNQARFYRVVQP
jgi:hypothetical protein